MCIYVYMYIVERERERDTVDPGQCLRSQPRYPGPATPIISRPEVPS